MCLSIGGSQGDLREHLVRYTKKKNSYKLVLLCSRKNYVSNPQCPGLITLHESK